MAAWGGLSCSSAADSGSGVQPSSSFFSNSSFCAMPDLVRRRVPTRLRLFLPSSLSRDLGFSTSPGSGGLLRERRVRESNFLLYGAPQSGQNWPLPTSPHSGQILSGSRLSRSGASTAEPHSVQNLRPAGILVPQPGHVSSGEGAAAGAEPDEAEAVWADWGIWGRGFGGGGGFFRGCFGVVSEGLASSSEDFSPAFLSSSFLLFFLGTLPESSLAGLLASLPAALPLLTEAR